MRVWKSTSLGLLLALSLVAYAAASPAPTPFLNGASCSATAAAAAPDLAALPPSSGGTVDAPAALPWLGASSVKVCNTFCTGRPSCLCENGTRGTCVSNECTPL